MIKSVTVYNHIGESIKLELGSPEKSGLLVQEIEGLGPGKATVNISEIATTDGAIFNSSRVPARNIVLKLVMMNFPTIEDSRQLTYRYFSIKKPVRLLIETDNRLVEVNGIVESNEPDIFSPQESTQISIVCPDPYLYSAGGGVNVTFSGIEPMFEFPFENDSPTEPMLEFGEIKDESSGVITYQGDADTGMVITISAIGAAENVTIYNVDTRETMKIDTAKISTLTGSGIVDGDTLLISTVKGSKGALLLRNGVYTNVMNCLDQDSDWFQLTKGDNVFVYTATSGEANLEFKIEYRMLFEGV